MRGKNKMPRTRRQSEHQRQVLRRNRLRELRLTDESVDQGTHSTLNRTISRISSQSSYNTVWRQLRRADESYRQVEQIQGNIRRQIRRSNEQYREAEQRRDAVSRQTRRADQQYREVEQIRDTISRQNRRNDPQYRGAEQTRDASSRRIRRSNTLY